MIVREEAIGYASASSSTQSTLQNPKFISATTTVYDNLDRPILVAGWRHDNAPQLSVIEGWADGFDGDYAMPSTVAAILALGPISLAHTLYDERGRPYEQRTYNVEVAGGSTYEFTRTYRDDLDRVIGELSPTGFVVNQYDGLGRVVCTAWWTKQPTGVLDSLLPNECESMSQPDPPPAREAAAVELTCTQSEYEIKWQLQHPSPKSLSRALHRKRRSRHFRTWSARCGSPAGRGCERRQIAARVQGWHNGCWSPRRWGLGGSVAAPSVCVTSAENGPQRATPVAPAGDRAAVRYSPLRPRRPGHSATPVAPAADRVRRISDPKCLFFACGRVAEWQTLGT